MNDLFTRFNEGDKRTRWYRIKGGERISFRNDGVAIASCNLLVPVTETYRYGSWGDLVYDLDSAVRAPRWYTRAWRWLRRKPITVLPTARVVK